MKAAGLLLASTEARGVLALTGNRTVKVDPLPAACIQQLNHMTDILQLLLLIYIATGIQTG